jgi:hypothetical protein
VGAVIGKRFSPYSADRIVIDCREMHNSCRIADFKNASKIGRGFQSLVLPSVNRRIENRHRADGALSSV